jgi:hypothetical protein
VDEIMELPEALHARVSLADKGPRQLNSQCDLRHVSLWNPPTTSCLDNQSTQNDISGGILEPGLASHRIRSDLPINRQHSSDWPTIGGLNNVATIDYHAALTLHTRWSMAIAVLLQLLPVESLLEDQWPQFQDSEITGRRRYYNSY